MTTIANVNGRLTILLENGAVDVDKASEGRFSAEPQAIYSEWTPFVEWARSANLSPDSSLPDDSVVWTPVPQPRQIVGVGLNYTDHIEHAGLQIPTSPGIFAKFFTALTGPYNDIVAPSPSVSTEVELALVIAKEAWNVSEDRALDYVAGVTIAQDLSDAASVVSVPKLDGTPAARYLNPAKSLAGFVPVGPYVVTLDEVGDLNDLSIELDIDDTVVQRGNTKDFVFGVPELIARVSTKIRLLPGDIILTGSADRVAGAHGLSLAPGQLVRARVGSLGEQRNRIVGAG